MPLIPALGRQRQVDLNEFEASLVYKASSRTARTVTHRNPLSQKQNKTKTLSLKNKTKQKQKQTNKKKNKTQIHRVLKSISALKTRQDRWKLLRDTTHC